jgi:hypothetical protein
VRSGNALLGSKQGQTPRTVPTLSPAFGGAFFCLPVLLLTSFIALQFYCFAVLGLFYFWLSSLSALQFHGLPIGLLVD